MICPEVDFKSCGSGMCAWGREGRGGEPYG